MEIDFANDEWDKDERLAYILYQMDGEQAVFDAVNRGKIRHDEWAVCEGFGTESPFLNGTCLVCSGGKDTSRDDEWAVEEEPSQGEIFDAVNDGSIEHDGWGYCRGCESESPHVNNVCLVCGQGVVPIEHACSILFTCRYPLKECDGE